MNFYQVETKKVSWRGAEKAGQKEGQNKGARHCGTKWKGRVPSTLSELVCTTILLPR